MKTPEVVVFDLGKVLVDFDYNIAARKFAARGKMSAEEIQHFIDHSPLLFRYETGLITMLEFYSEICAATGFSGCDAEFCEIFSDIFSPIDSMIELHGQLRRQNIPTYIFSNTNELAVRHIRQHYSFFNNFDGYILSYQHGAMKPQPKIYEVVERETGKQGDAILYIDDRAENVAAGAARGWRTILQEEPAKTRSAMQRLGLVS